MKGKIEEVVVQNGKVLKMVLQCEERDFEVFKIIAAAQVQDQHQSKLDFNETKFFWTPL